MYFILTEHRAQSAIYWTFCMNIPAGWYGYRRWPPFIMKTVTSRDAALDVYAVECYRRGEDGFPGSMRLPTRTLVPFAMIASAAAVLTSCGSSGKVQANNPGDPNAPVSGVSVGV